MRYLIRVHTLAAALLAFALLPAAGVARVHKLERLVVIGDSYSDGGNSGLLTQSAVPPAGFPPAPYVGGRLSNGPVAMERLWRLYNPTGPALRPSEVGGSNFAVAGATTGVDNALAVDPNPNTVPLRPFYVGTSAAAQLADALTTVDPNPERSLYVVWLGGNDVLYWFNSGGLTTGEGSTPGTMLGGSPVAGVDLPTVIGNAVTNVITAVSGLIAKGATNILVPNQLDFGRAPLYNTSLLAPQISLIAQGFNAGLSSGLQALQAANPGVDIMEFDTFNLFDQVADNPAGFGFDNVA
ncbi:MAG: SGNH/GDSL hydrolase family protein, partial [Cyanobacteriota bacterium]|nr:SGNH/GDSL hydrolase family protein [Cyanobacteriota bacterium]